MAKMWTIQKLSPPEKIGSFNFALKGANDFLCLPSDAKILKYNIQCVKKIRKYLFMH